MTMASPPIPPATAARHSCSPPVSNFNHLSCSSPPILNSFLSCGPSATTCFSPAHTSGNRNLRRSVPSSASNTRRWSGFRRASSPGSPSPPELDPPPGDSPDASSGVMSRFSKVKDTVRIFFAVFFWMSLFFWSCVWDGKDDGRPNKGSRFRK